MHVHDSALHASVVFASVLLLGTVWRIASFHLIGHADGTFANKLGRAMAVQY